MHLALAFAHNLQILSQDTIVRSLDLYLGGQIVLVELRRDGLSSVDALDIAVAFPLAAIGSRAIRIGGRIGAASKLGYATLGLALGQQRLFDVNLVKVSFVFSYWYLGRCSLDWSSLGFFISGR